MSHVGEVRIPFPSQEVPSPPQYVEFVGYFSPSGMPIGCPSAGDPALPENRYLYPSELYRDTVCPHNCPKGQPRSQYPYEPDIGGPDYYKNGYHDLYGLEK
jgi:hypothetical protein